MYNAINEKQLAFEKEHRFVLRTIRTIVWKLDFTKDINQIH